MEFPGLGQDARSVNPNAGGGDARTPSVEDFRALRPPFHPAHLFPGFPGMANNMPFGFPPMFVPPPSGAGFGSSGPAIDDSRINVPGLGFTSSAARVAAATVNVSEGSQKRPTIKSVAGQSRPQKKLKNVRKKPDIVDLEDAKEDVELLKNVGHWKDLWVIQLIIIRGEMQNKFSAPPKQGVDNWSRLHARLVLLCPDFTKDSEVCRKKWSSMYNDYKEDKATNNKSGCQKSEKCRWYQLVDEYMFDRANVVSHAHASALNPDGPMNTTTSDTNTSEHQSGDESTSKSPEPKRKDDIFLERCIGEIRKTSKSLMDSIKASDDMKMALLMSMHQTMQKLIEKL